MDIISPYLKKTFNSCTQTKHDSGDGSRTGGIAKSRATHIASLGLPELTYHSPMNALSFGSLLWYIYGILHVEIVAYHFEQHNGEATLLIPPRRLLSSLAQRLRRSLRLIFQHDSVPAPFSAAGQF